MSCLCSAFPFPALLLSPVSSPAFSCSHPQQNRTPWLQGCFLCERGETVSGPTQNGKCAKEMPREQFWYIFGAVSGKCLPGGSHGAMFVHFLVHGGKCPQEAPKEQFWCMSGPNAEPVCEKAHMEHFWKIVGAQARKCPQATPTAFLMQFWLHGGKSLPGGSHGIRWVQKEMSQIKLPSKQF